MTRLQLEDIRSLMCNKIGESLNLDYKKELGSNEEIAKDISAFANTLGGKIIYGVNEEGGIPVSMVWIDKEGVKERIENVILSRIQPELKGYDIYSIENPKKPLKRFLSSMYPKVQMPLIWQIICITYGATFSLSQWKIMK